MSGYFYLDVTLKLANRDYSALPVFVKGSIENSLHKIFGEIGGHTTVDLLKYEEKRHRAILRVPEKFYVKLRAALTLINTFQGVPCRFHVNTTALPLPKSKMSYCKDYGKDKVIFATKEDHAKPSTVELPDTERAPGLILPNGEINWNCPCLGGMATGPCGVEFREAFSCFHYSDAEPKGSDCYDQFSTMQECFSRYPTVYNKSGDDDDDDDAVDGAKGEPKNGNVFGALAGDNDVETVDQMDELSSSRSKPGANNTVETTSDAEKTS